MFREKWQDCDLIIDKPFLAVSEKSLNLDNSDGEPSSLDLTEIEMDRKTPVAGKCSLPIRCKNAIDFESPKLLFFFLCCIRRQFFKIDGAFKKSRPCLFRPLVNDNGG